MSRRQPGRRTVQGELERVLSVLCGNAISIDGTGRTDAGVHALGQCATFSAEFGIPVDRLMRAANDMLAESRLKGGDVSINVGPGGRRRFSRPVQRGRKALYFIGFSAESRCPFFCRNYRYHVRQPLDTDAMASALKAFEGTHDFRRFDGGGGAI